MTRQKDSIVLQGSSSTND